MVELKTHKLWCQYNGCTHCGNSNGSGWENYSSHQTLYVLTFIGNWAYIYLLTLNKKRKMKIGGHGSSLWLLCLCVLCFVFCAASKTIQCSWVSPYFIFWKMKIMSYVFWQISSSIKSWPEKITTGKKRYCVSFFGQCSQMSPYFICWKMKIMSHLSTHT